MSFKELVIEGARQNNLKNISLTLPHNKVIAVTGVSGSGKSSLAFDTIFAEGQWRFIESLSTYARLFLEKIDRPDVDAIHNIRPAIALEQKNPVKGSRSTVGTLTELYDLFRLLYSKIAHPFCPNCSKEIRIWDTSQIFMELIEKYTDKKAIIVFEAPADFNELLKNGFHRIWLNNEIIDIEDLETLINRISVDEIKDKLNIVVDRLLIKDEPRLSDSIELAWNHGKGKIKIIIMDETVKVLTFSSKNSCDECNIELPLPNPLLFSFNHPLGACPKCNGFGNLLHYDETLIIPNKSLSLSDGAIDPWNKPAYRWWKQQLIKNAEKAGLSTSKPYSEFLDSEKEILFNGTADFYGINDFFQELETKKYKLHIRVFLSRYRSPAICPLCKGKKLKKEALSYKVSGLDIGELCSMPVIEIAHYFEQLDISPFQRDTAREILRQIKLKLDFLKRVGLDYLSLNRDARTLSGGEYQRINLSNQIASFLTGTLYVLDEPTVGLHARDTQIIAGIMSELSKLGNTIIVVEHDKNIINSADVIVELGPGGGYKGGEVIFSGNREEFLFSDTPTSRYIKGIEYIFPPSKKKSFTVKSPIQNKIVLIGAKGNNLKDINLSIPLQTFTTITGVSGSGKSSLIVETLYRALAREFKQSVEMPLAFDKLIAPKTLKSVKLISQSPIGKSPRSNPVTYLKIFDLIRNLFASQPEARTQRYSPGYFSFNVSGGRCETCKGAGYQKMEMYFFEDLYIKCETCNGKRYKPEALKVYYRGKNIDEVLRMTVDEAVELFRDERKIVNKLSLMQDIGLGYLILGQPATTLSGGEAQRLKICAEFAENSRHTGDVLYILDEPTIGLHFKDIKALLNILQRLVDSGNTVIIIEHNLDVINYSDWIIDLGPEGGEKGGKIIFEGTPDEIINCQESYTGKYLREHLYTQQASHNI
jgi:excinuclease ABC subunit A